MTTPRQGDLRTPFDRHLDAFNRQDLDGLLAGFTDDAVWITGTDSFRGRDELTELFRGAFAVAPVLRAVSVLVDGGRIAAAKIYREGSADLPG
jgi:ketosteroid isomerase-like protein